MNIEKSMRATGRIMASQEAFSEATLRDAFHPNPRTLSSGPPSKQGCVCGRLVGLARRKSLEVEFVEFQLHSPANRV
jgi:hypothetical protein